MPHDDDKYRTQRLERLPEVDPARQEEIAQLQKLLEIHRRTLSHYLNQQAALGTAHAPPAITSGIYEARENIKQIKRTLREWGVPVRDRPGDETQDNLTHALASARKPIPWVVGGALALSTVALLAVVLLWGGARTAQPSQVVPSLPSAALQPTATSLPTTIPTPTPIPTVQPVAEGKYMVLVAELEPVNTDKRDVTRLIAASLERTFERDFPLSNVAVRTYRGVVTSDAEARDLAERTKAAVIVWGKYFNDKQIQLDVQVGSLAPFPQNIFDRGLIEQTANLQIQLHDPVEQSIAPQVLNVVNVMHVADGNTYNNGRILELLGRYIDVVQGTEDNLDIKNPPADLYLARGLALCIGKQYPEAEAAYARGLDLDPNFALLHLLRAEVRQKQQNEQGALEDLGAVQQSSLAPYLDAAQAGKLGCETLLATR